MRKKRRNRRILFVLTITFALTGGLLSCIFYFFSPGVQTKNIVNDFYTFEQEADFSDSWELLHPYMQDRWTKSEYVKDRIHVFIGHFGTETFNFTVEKDKKITGWKMSKDLPAVGAVYKYNVIQTYKGKYGKFQFSQAVYVAKDKGEWKILWDYN